MRLTDLYIKDFQSVKGEINIDLEKLTLLYGPNSAGKSSVIDAFRLIQTFVAGKGLRGTTTDARFGFSAVADWGVDHYIQTYTNMDMSLASTNRDVDDAILELRGKTLSLRFKGFRDASELEEFTISVDGEILLCSSSNIDILKSNLFSEESGNVALPDPDSHDWSNRFTAINTSFTNFRYLFDKFRECDDVVEEYAGRYLLLNLSIDYLSAESISNIFSCGYSDWASDEQQYALRDFREFLFALQQMFESSLHWHHVKGDRQIIPKDSYTYTGYDSPLIGTDQGRWSPYGQYASALANPNNEGRKVGLNFAEACLQKYLKSLEGYRYVIGEIRNLDSEQIIRIKVENREAEILDFEDVGSGLSYIFPIIGALAFRRTSFVEQPELHLHPAAQCEIADVFIAGKKTGAAAIIESHSEHLLLRLMRRIRETTLGYLIREELKLDCDDVRILYFNPTEDGKTEVIEIRIDEHGEFLNNWPNGFFSEREKELFQENWEGAPHE